VRAMAYNRMIIAGAARLSDALPSSLSAVPPPRTSRFLLTAADYAELMRELDELRGRHRNELAQRLRDARDFGSPGDDDDRLTAFEDAAIDQARIAHLEQLAQSASVVDTGSSTGEVAGLGSTVRVADEAGGTIEYELVGRRVAGSTPRQVSLASPVGRALVGARPGDVAHVALPSGRARALRVLEVSGERLAIGAEPHQAAIKAA
jgi:transcription elongation factor GreA